MANQPGLIAVAREKMRTRHLALRTEQSYVQWLRRFIAFHGRKHPREVGAAGVEQFLTHLAVDRKVSAATQNQALQALLFVYRHVLEIDLPWLDGVTRASQPKRLPVVLTRQEVHALLVATAGDAWLVASLLYGSGLRLTEGLRLRVKDLAIERGELIVREPKGGRDRVTTLPSTLEAALRAHLARLRAWFEEERRAGRPGVSLPFALARKYPHAPTQWGWQYLFPSAALMPGFGAEVVGAPSHARERHPARGPGRRCAGRASASRQVVTRCATASPRTCWRMAMTSARCRSCWVTAT